MCTPIFTASVLTVACCCKVTSVVSDSVRPHRLQPIRLHIPWDFPGKNTRVGCHLLLQCMKVKSESEVLSDSLQHHGLQLIRLLCPWDFPSKSTGVGCHFLLHHSSLETTYYRNNLSICQHVKRLKQCDVIYVCVCVCVCVCVNFT